MATNINANLALSQFGLWKPCQTRSSVDRLKLRKNMTSIMPAHIFFLTDMVLQKKYSGASRVMSIPAKKNGIPSGLTVSYVPK